MIIRVFTPFLQIYLTSVLCSLEAWTELKQEMLEILFFIQYAKIKFLQEEYAPLLVSGQIDASTAKSLASAEEHIWF